MAKGLGCSVEIALRLQERALVDAQGGVIGVGRDGRLIMRERFGAEAGVVQSQSELQVAHREIGLAGERLPVSCDGRLVFGLAEESVTEVIARRRASGTAGRALRQQFLGTCEVAVVDEARAEVVVVMSRAGIPDEGLFHQADAFGGLAEVESGEPEEMPDIMAVRQQFEQALVDPGGVGEATRLMESHRVVEGGLRVGELHVGSEVVVVGIARINSSGAGHTQPADHLISW